MKIHYLRHVPFEGPGYIQSWADQQGHRINETRLYDSPKLPEPDKLDALIIMGGPMSVHDEEKYPWLKREKACIARCIERGKKVLGICLGAQLIAEVLGADVTSMPEKEIGWFPINWSREARRHPALDFLPARQKVLHWHGDRFDLPENAIGLAASKACENQGFLLDDQVLGLQFHLEMTKEGLAELITNSKNELRQASGSFIQHEDTMLSEHCFDKNHRTIHRLLDAFLANTA